jgi:type IV secretion system protein VirD4
LSLTSPQTCPGRRDHLNPPARGSGQTTFGGLRLSAARLVHRVGQHVHLDPPIRHCQINLWLNPYVDAATAESDFDLRSFREERISLYLGVSPDDLDRVAPIYNLLFQQLIDLNVRELPSGDRHQVRLLLLLDEFPRLGRASVIANGFSYVAGYGIRLLPVIQNGAQLENVYGPKVATEIEANCGVQMVMRPATTADAREISKGLAPTPFARSRSMGTWGRGGGSV